MIQRARRWCEGWALWQLPRRVLVFVLVVNFLAAALSVVVALQVTVGTLELRRLAVLAACAWLAIELTRHIERKREHARRDTVAYIDTRAVWNFAAVIVLPPALAAVIVVFFSVLAWHRIQPRAGSHVMYRWVFTCSTLLLGTYVASFVLASGMSNYPGAPEASLWTGLIDVGVIAIAGILRWGVNAGLVMAAIALSNPMLRVRDLFSNFSEQFLEAAASGLGLVAATVVVVNPLVLPGIVIAIVALHRSLLVSQYQTESRTDAKTGLASAGWWHKFAEQAFARSQDRDISLGLLMVDLDHFKVINDTHGHPFGDEVLRGVGDELRAEIRDDDACGRWGGEEFAVVLPDVADEESLYRVAERLRLRIQSLTFVPPERTRDCGGVNLTASFGGALYPAKGITTLDELLLAADAALYEAKNSGRNQVRIGPAGADAPPEVPLPSEERPPIDRPRPSTN